MTGRESSTGPIDAQQMRSAVLIVTWGYCLGAVSIVRWGTTPGGWIGFPSVFGPLVVLVGLTCFPREGAPVEFIGRLWMAGGATVIGWVAGNAAYFGAPAPVASFASVVGTAVGLVLVVSTVTRLFVGQAAAEPLRAWRRLTWTALVVAAVSVAGMFMAAEVIPALPGASRFAGPHTVPFGGSVYLVGDYVVTGTALVVTLAFVAALAAAILAMVVLAVPALGALKRWAKTERPEDDDPPTRSMPTPTESRSTKP